jgi:L-rhamnose 1-dehydrogenase
MPMLCVVVALGKYGIRANAVLPGTIATDINKEDLSDTVKREGMIARTCLGRLGQPDDIAGPVVFLARYADVLPFLFLGLRKAFSNLAKYITGSSLLVDGGLFVNLQ